MPQQMTGGQAVVRSLIKLGVDTIFALPGVQNDYLFNALHEHQDQIRVIHTRHEQGAAYMAMGYAVARNQPGVYSVVPGPGVLNTTAALSTAYAVGAKVLCLTGQIASSDIGQDVGVLHEIPDQLGIIQRLTKWAERIDSPAAAPALVTEAFAQMLNGRPQPVGLEVPPDVLAGVGEVDLSDVAVNLGEPEVDLDAVKAAAKLLGSAENPLIVVGGGAMHAGTEVQALAEMLQAPIMPGRNGRGVVSSRHPLSLTVPEGYKYWGEADVVIGIGSRMYRPIKRFGTDDQLKIVRIDIDPSVPDHYQPADVKLVSDSKTTLRALLNALPAHNRSRPNREADVLAHRADMNKKYQALEPQYSFVKAIRAALPDNGLFVDEVSQIGFAAQFMLPVYHPNSFITSGYQGTLGYGFATALGVKAGFPDRPVLSVAGDGGFMYNVQELATAAKHGINLVTVVFADGAFGNVKRMQKNLYDEKYIASDLHNPDFVALADSFGVMGMRVDSAEKLQISLREAFRANVPVLIEVPVGEMPSPWPLKYPAPNRG